jgi:hypothetical protein
MKNEILPIGSIVTINDTDVMICGYLDNKKSIDNDYYDYCGCLYPNGFQENAVLIKKSQITRVKHIGFQDLRFAKLKMELEKDNG